MNQSVRLASSCAGAERISDVGCAQGLYFKQFDSLPMTPLQFIRMVKCRQKKKTVNLANKKENENTAIKISSYKLF